MAKSLSIVCVTKNEWIVQPLLHEMSALAHRLDAEFVLGLDCVTGVTMHCDQKVRVQSKGYQEDVQDEVIAHATGRYVLCLDDDEKVSKNLEDWLKMRMYELDDRWYFARAWMMDSMNWNTRAQAPHFIASSPHWPDFQARLTVKEKAGGRRALHQGPPHGYGQQGAGAIEHYKLVLRTEEERETLLKHYDARQQGAGEAFRCFYVPTAVTVEPWGDYL